MKAGLRISRKALKRGQHCNSILEDEFREALDKEGVEYAKTGVGKLV